MLRLSRRAARSEIIPATCPSSSGIFSVSINIVPAIFAVSYCSGCHVDNIAVAGR